MRTDSAGCTDFVWAARARNFGFAVVARSNASIHAAISRVAFDDDAWQPTRRQDGDERPGATVVELTDLVDLTDWPPYPTHHAPRAPASRRPAEPVPLHHVPLLGPLHRRRRRPRRPRRALRAHAHVEDNIRRLKDSGAHRFPFVDIDANRAWLAVVCFADALVRWFQLLCLTGTLAFAEPKTLRWGLWHAPGRLVHLARRRIVRILDGWPTTATLLDAYGRIALIT